MPLDAISVDDWVTAPAAGSAAAVATPAAAAAPAAPAPASTAGKDDWVTQAPLKDLPGGSSSPATESYGFDVPSAAAQPQINTAVAPTPPAALEAAKQNVTSIADVPARVGAAMIAAWRNTPDILTPQAQDWLANAEKNSPRPNLQDVLTVGHAALAAGSAVFQGGLAGIGALGDVVGQPELARDVAGYYEAQGMADAPHFPGVLRTTLPETRAVLTEQSIAARQALASPGPDLGAMAIKVMNAPDVNAAIAAATEATRDPQPASMYRPAPAAIPPNAAAPVLPRILDLINQDDTVAANRPAEIPPNAAQPNIPLGWGDMSASKPGVDPALTDDIMNPPGSRPTGAATDLTAAGAATPSSIPQSVGAAASRQGTPINQIALSNTDMKANRYQAEMNELLAPPTAGDTKIYVNGSLPTLAEYSGDPLISQQENLIRQRNPTAFIGEGKRLTENNTARVSEYENQTPSRTALDTMRDDRATQWETDSRNILPNAQPADLTPAMDWVEGQLADPKIQENDAVRNVLQDFRDRLVDENGDMKTDPAAVWGIHDNIQNQLAKAKDPLNATGAEKFAFNELMQAKKVTDDALNVSTNNQFQTALDNYAKASQAINSGEELESFRPKLTNASGMIMGDRFHKFVVDLAMRRGDPGIDPAMNISDDTMRSLINIDSDLKRSGNIKLGAAAGSPTNLLGALAAKMGLGAAHIVAGHLLPGVGNMILHAGADAAAGKLGQYRLNKLTEKHLAAPEGGYVYPGSAP